MSTTSTSLPPQESAVIPAAEGRGTRDLPRFLEIVLTNIANGGDARTFDILQVLHEGLRASARADTADTDGFVGRIPERRGGIAGRHGFEESPRAPDGP